jgi:hypothetical protein
MLGGQRREAPCPRVAELKGSAMKLSDKGKSVYAEVGFWLEKDGSIHMTIKGIPGGHIAVNEDSARKNGHGTLFKRLAWALEKMGAPAPK